VFCSPPDFPKDNPAALWELQTLLLREAELMLGDRDLLKKIYQPQFDEFGPHIRNTPNLDGAFVELSENAKRFWPSAIYEMAHETVHLLNPVVGYTNWLEEGIAVDFSLHAQSVFSTAPVQSPALGAYKTALALVRSIPEGSFAIAKKVRATAGALSLATPDALTDLSPGMDRSLAELLCSRCVPR
jgi:hypothetical protein